MKRLFLIFCGALFLTCGGSFSKFNPEKDGKMLWEVCELPPPPESRKLEERDIFRPHAGTVSKFYSRESGCPAVKNHYERILKDRGWEKVPYSYFGNYDDNRFKKGDVTFHIYCEEITDFWGVKRYSFSCSK